MKLRNVETAKRRNVETSNRQDVASESFRLFDFLKFGFCFIGICAHPAAAQSPADRFVATLETDTTIPAEASELIRATWSKCQGCDEDEFLTQALAVLSPSFRRGLDAYEAEAYQDCVDIMRKLRSASNPFVATHAAAYEIKSLVAMERLLDAGKRIQLMLSGSGQMYNASIDAWSYSYLAPELGFLRGFCLLADLQYDAAAAAMDEFVTTYPDSSQRLVIAARQMLAELANRRTGEIGEVVDLMSFSGRRLGHADSGKTVQTRQQRIVDILDELIEEAEKQESDSSNSSGGSGSSSGQSGGAQPSNPMQQSQRPGGRPADGPLRARRRASPGEMWGSMPPAQRERILQALRDNFPSRYRRLVEQYYEELAKTP